MAAILEELPVVKDKAPNADQNSTQPPPLQPKPFFWDSIIFYLVSAILGLSVSGIIVEFLRPNQNLVACFSPFDNRAQYTYINSYCHKHLPTAEYFSIALVLHAAALVAPHYLWKVYVSSKVDFFFSHAAKLETLRERDTGEYPHKNFSIVDYIHREFYDRKIILALYVTKLFFQFFLVGVSYVVSAIVFTDFEVTFECHEDIERSHLFGNVTCAYPRILFINVLRVADYILLSLAMVILGFGIYWCLLHSHPTELGHLATSQFCYDSCINSKFYKPRKWYRLKNDFHFLLASLYATNAGLGRVFKSVQIANDISHELSAHFESLASYDSMKHSISGRENDQKLNKYNFFRHHEDSTSFGELMYDLCEAISKDLGKTGHNTSQLAAMDIGCGHHSYMFGVARWQLQVISIILDSYYKNKKEIFTSGEYHAGVMLLRIPTNLFGLQKQYKRMFAQKISDFIGLTNNDDTDEDPIKFSLIVVGPLDSQRKHNTVNQIVEMHSRSHHFFIQGAVMLIIKPIAVENVDISGHFNDWKPESSKFWRVSPILKARSDWPKCQSVIDDSRFIPNGCVVNIKCGQSNCKFQLTAYQYHFDPEDFNPSPSITTINTDVQGDRSLSGSVDCLKPNNAAYLQDDAS